MIRYAVHSETPIESSSVYSTFRERLNDPKVKQQRSKFYKAFYKTEQGKKAIEKARKTKKDKNLSTHNSIKLYCIETNKVYDSLTKFQKEHGIDRHKIHKLFKETNNEYIEVIDKYNSSLLHIKISV